MRWRADPAGAVAALALCASLAGAAETEATEAPRALAAIAPPAGAAMVWSGQSDPGAYAAPLAPADAAGGPVSRTVEGSVFRTTWRMADATSLEAARAFAAPYLAAGYVTALDCGGAACGGFSFRMALDLAPWPQMRVSALDFHQITLRRGDALTSILASRTGSETFVQVVSVTQARPSPAATPAPRPRSDRLAASPAPSPPAAPDSAHSPQGESAHSPQGGSTQSPQGDDAATRAYASLAASPWALAQALAATGSVVLDGISFETGGATPDASSAPSFDRAAEALQLLAGRDAVVVGHTDNDGPLAVNLRVSQARAEAVRAALVARGVAPQRLQAAGAGWLSPLVPNDSEANRARNRRVELVLR